MRRHVEDAFPALAARPATEITAADLRSVLARLVRSGVRVETLSTAVAELSTTLLASKDITAPFRLSDIRRTAETVLAGLGV